MSTMQDTPTLSRGNSKLGSSIFTWSLPAIQTCPGSTGICRQRCYAARGFFLMSSVKAGYQFNLDFSRTDNFSPWFIRELVRNDVRTLRIHVSGDFYDLAYIAKWQEIVEASKHVQFFAYTRSWRIAELLPALRSLGNLPNMSLWWSEDRQTGEAPLDKSIRRAYLAINDPDAATAPAGCDLVFRDKPNSVLKRANGVLVCPVENGVTHASGFHHLCSTCRLCFTGKTSVGMQQLLSAAAVELSAPRAIKKRKGKNSHVHSRRHPEA
jgi:hypothetical protein